MRGGGGGVERLTVPPLVSMALSAVGFGMVWGLLRMGGGEEEVGRVAGETAGLAGPGDGRWDGERGLVGGGGEGRVDSASADVVERGVGGFAVANAHQHSLTRENDTGDNDDGRERSKMAEEGSEARGGAWRLAGGVKQSREGKPAM